MTTACQDEAETFAPRAQVLPGSKVLRGRVISLLHRLVECLGERLLPLLPAALASLLPVTADAPDVCDVSALLGQLAARYKAALAPLLAKACPQQSYFWLSEQFEA